jgi:hypothetical protein
MHGDSELAILDGRTGARLTSISTNPGPYFLAMNLVTDRVYIGTSGVLVVDGSTGAPLRRRHDLGGIFAVDTVANRLYANPSDNLFGLLVLDGDTEEVIARAEPVPDFP